MRCARGFSKLELLVVLCIFGVLAGTLLSRLVAVERQTEQLEVDLVLRHIDVGLKLAIGERIIRGEENKIAELAEASPLDFLARSDGTSIDGKPNLSRWSYDAPSRKLTYLVRQPEAFDGRLILNWRFLATQDSLGRTVGLHLEALK
jgi:type II secretory pathway pseudopilin PulG